MSNQMLLTSHILKQAKGEWIGYFVKPAVEGIKAVPFMEESFDTPGFYFVVTGQLARGFTYVGNTRTKGGFKRFVSSIRNSDTGPTASMNNYITQGLKTWNTPRIYFISIENMKYLLNLEYGVIRQKFNKTPKSDGQSLEEIKQRLHDLYVFTSQTSRQ